MLDYGKCKKIAENYAKNRGVKIDSASKIGEDYVFDNSKEKYIGILPFVVNAENGECGSLWHYLNNKDMTMDDM